MLASTHLKVLAGLGLAYTAQGMVCNRQSSSSAVSESIQGAVAVAANPTLSLGVDANVEQAATGTQLDHTTSGIFFGDICALLIALSGLSSSQDQASSSASSLLSAASNVSQAVAPVLAVNQAAPAGPGPSKASSASIIPSSTSSSVANNVQSQATGAVSASPGSPSSPSTSSIAPSALHTDEPIPIYDVD